MTQTVRKNKTKFGCDIYYHPNTCKPARNDSRTRYRYRVDVHKLEHLEDELKKYYGHSIDWSDVAENEYIQNLILEIGNGAKYTVSDEYGNHTVYCRNLKEVYRAFDEFDC